MKREIKDYFFLLRPTLLGPVWIFLITGYRLTYLINREPMPRIIYNPVFWIGFISYTMLMSGVYILNQIVDRKTDKTNHKLFLLSEGIIPVLHAYIEMFFLWIVSFILIWFIRTDLLIIIWGISLLMGIIYSMPPFRLKGRFLWDIIWNVAGYGFFNVIFGALLKDKISMDLVLYLIPYLLGVAAIFIYTTLLDIEGDKKEGIKTTGMILGYKRGSLVSLIFLFAAGFISLYTKDYVILFTAIASLPFAVWTYLKSSRYAVIISMRVGPLFLLLGISFYAPWILVLLLVLGIFMRVYYKKKFNLTYPTLTGKG